MERAVVDRIEEGGLAVLLVGDAQTERVVPLRELPAGAGEGSWLIVTYEDSRLVDARLDADETERTRQRIDEKMRRLRERGRRL